MPKEPLPDVSSVAGNIWNIPTCWDCGHVIKSKTWVRLTGCFKSPGKCHGLAMHRLSLAAQFQTCCNLRCAKSRDSYRRIASKSHRHNSNHLRSVAVMSPPQTTEIGPHKILCLLRCDLNHAIGVHSWNISSTWNCRTACES